MLLLILQLIFGLDLPHSFATLKNRPGVSVGGGGGGAGGGGATSIRSTSAQLSPSSTSCLGVDDGAFGNLR